MWKKLVCLALCLALCALPAGAAGLSEGAMEEKALASIGLTREE